jgi:uncharacterized membrane protein
MIMTNDPLEMYISRFQANLLSMTPAERQDIVDEIRSHVHDRVAAYGLSIPEVLERLGPPETVAGEYHRGNLVRERLSLLGLLRIAYAAVVTAFHGIFLMVITFYGYASALACFGFLIARMLFPEQTALWMTQDWELGMGADRPPDATVFLENSLQPIAFGIAAVLFGLTTLLFQRTWRSMKRWYRRATGPLEIPTLPGAREAVSSVSKQFRDARSRLMRVRTRWQNS